MSDLLLTDLNDQPSSSSPVTLVCGPVKLLKDEIQPQFALPYSTKSYSRHVAISDFCFFSLPLLSFQDSERIGGNPDTDSQPGSGHTAASSPDQWSTAWHGLQRWGLVWPVSFISLIWSSVMHCYLLCPYEYWPISIWTVWTVPHIHPFIFFKF